MSFLGSNWIERWYLSVPILLNLVKVYKLGLALINFMQKYPNLFGPRFPLRASWNNTPSL